MKTSSRGIVKLKVLEGCKLAAYQDTNGTWTIGYGHTGLDVTPNTVWTQAQADIAIVQDLEVAEKCINTSVRTKLSQPQFDALAIFIYNVGVSAFTNSTMRRFLNEGKIDAASKQFDRWIFETKNGRKVVNNGLVNRRNAEQAIFNSIY